MEGTERGKEEDEEREQRPEDGECISRERVWVHVEPQKEGEKEIRSGREKKRGIKAKIERNTV